MSRFSESEVGWGEYSWIQLGYWTVVYYDEYLKDVPWPTENARFVWFPVQSYNIVILGLRLCLLCTCGLGCCILSCLLKKRL